MANEKRLIDANALHDFVSEEFKDDVPYEWAWALTVVDHAPAVDAVPVVRCKDCKHHHYCEIHFCDALGMDCPDDSKFFCSYGERKDGDGNG